MTNGFLGGTMHRASCIIATVNSGAGHSAVTTQNWYYHLMPGEMERAIALKPSLNLVGEYP